MRQLLTSMGDRFTDEEVDEMYREAPIKNGMFDYAEFTRCLIFYLFSTRKLLHQTISGSSSMEPMKRSKTCDVAIK